jgi:signal transduction histidine kinase
MYVYTWYRLDPLTGREFYILTDVYLLALFSAAMVLSVWLRHRRLTKELVMQAAVLREELDLRARLQALITHDIRNPLMVLLNAADCDDPRTVQVMSMRIAAIVDSAKDLTFGSVRKLGEVTLSEIGVHLNDVFAARLALKGQTLSVIDQPGLVMVTDMPILCNSILGNLLSNAIKFSPRGATISLTIESVGQFVRLMIADQGAGFPSDVLRQADVGRIGHHSKAGTEGERGTGYGLHIAALCAERLGGSIEIRNSEHGGAVVSVLLPCRMRSAHKLS